MSDLEMANGSGDLSPETQSLAQQLKQKHAARDAHNPTVEEIVDEEDALHPPPSAKLQEPSSAAPTPKQEPLSERAMGKQKAKDVPQNNEPPQVSAPKGLDTASEELFPALGSGPKPRANAHIPAAWGSTKPAAVAHGPTNGLNGYGPSSGTNRSQSSTPGVMTPSTTASAPMYPQGPQHMSMPGRHSERVQFAPSQLLPRKEMRRPMADVLREINRRSKATVEMKAGPGGMVYFEGKGPVDAVRQALKDVAKEVGSKQSVKVPIAANIRSHIIGRQGATVQGITKRTGARIQVPRAEEVPAEMEDDDDNIIDVVIEGDAVAAEMARREIEAIVNEQTSISNVRLRDIPAEFYPFLTGPHNAGIEALENGRDVRIKVPTYHTWSNQPPPQTPAPGQQPIFAPHPAHHIHLSGDRLAVQEARAEIELQVEDLRRRITLSQLAINRGQHQFIVGDDGSALHELLAETGCAVILPPDNDETEMLTITGPHDRIELGMDKVMNLATSMQMSSVDIARQHANAPLGSQAHAWALTRYLRQRQAIAQLEKLYDSRINLPTSNDGPITWEIYSREGKNTIRARSDVINVINAHPPTRFRHLEMDPFFHGHLREQHHQLVRDEFGVHLLLPEEHEEDVPVFLVYEGPSSNATFEPPRQRPSQAEVGQYEQALAKAQEHIMSIISGHDTIGVQTVDVPTKFHDKVRRFVSREQQDLPSQSLPVQFTPAPIATPGLTLRGPDSQLNELISRINDFVIAEKQDELERGFTTSFDFPQKYANFLIGKRGETINKLREEFDVEIQINEGKVELKGPKAKTEAAKARILAMGKKLDDEATHVLKIKPQYHRDLIGARGSQVNRLQERYNVRVQFPRTARDDDSNADAASETGGHRSTRKNQAPDEVIVRGPRKGADEARDELLSLLQYTIDTSHGSSVSVQQSQLPSLIGQGGKEMESIREITGANIDVPGSRESIDPSGRVEIKIKGTKTQVEKAKKLLEERAKVFDETATKSLNVDKKYHKSLIGSGGANIRNIVLAAGGSDDRRELAKTVRFPKVDSDDSTIRIEGSKAVVESIVNAIEAFVGQRENQTTEIVEVAPEKHRQLIGAGGETRRGLEQRFEVSIDIPRQGQQGPSRSHVKIAGQPDKVQKAKEHILELTKDQAGETIQVPRGKHHSISDNGQLFRRLRSDHRVTIDHAGHQPPPKPSAQPRPHVNGNASMPLITDEDDSINDHSWEIVDNSTESSEEGDIPWVLHGSPESVAKARDIIQKALSQNQQSSRTGYLILPDPKTYRFVIGPGGAQINAIRKQTGCKIDVPRNQAKGEAIEIAGSLEGVEQAKDIILDVVKSGAAGGGGGRR